MPRHTTGGITPQAPNTTMTELVSDYDGERPSVRWGETPATLELVLNWESEQGDLRAECLPMMAPYPTTRPTRRVDERVMGDLAALAEDFARTVRL